jgi:hypothetical protein
MIVLLAEWYVHYHNRISGSDQGIMSEIALHIANVTFAISSFTIDKNNPSMIKFTVTLVQTGQAVVERRRFI